MNIGQNSLIAFPDPSVLSSLSQLQSSYTVFTLIELTVAQSASINEKVIGN